MPTLLSELPEVAKRNNDVSQKIDAEALRIAKIVAAYEGKSTAEYLSDLILKHASAELEAWQAKGINKASKPKGGKK